MALFDIKLFSTSLLTNTDIRVIVPTPDEPFFPDTTPFYQPGKKYQVLYLLHGGYGDCTVWTRNTGIERYAQKHKLLVVSASVTNSFYLDMAHGGKFFTYMTKELPAFINGIFPVSQRRQDTFIGGISMGGYGAYRIAFGQPERFSCAASLSGALDIVEMMEGQLGSGQRQLINMEDVFGKKAVEGTDNDLFALIEKRKREGKILPKLFQCCGTEDFLYPMNKKAKLRLESLGMEVTYQEGAGIHNWDYWDWKIQEVLDWLPLANTLVDG